MTETWVNAMQMPWMHAKEIQMMEKYLTPETCMLEWGSGGSTVYFSQKVKQYFSIEHCKKYFKPIPTATCVFRPPNIEVPPAESTYESYKDYVDAASEFGCLFDIILIDGRARVACAKKALEVLKPDGVLFVHDFWKRTRGRYRPILDWFREVESVKDTKQTIIVLKRK